MKIFGISLFITVLFASCQSQTINKNTNSKAEADSQKTVSFINPTGKTIISRFNLPEGYSFSSVQENSWGSFLRSLPLKPDGSEVKTFNGTVKPNYQTYLAVVDLPIGKKDLHQCADAIMRLRADYLFSQSRFKDISFRQASGKTLSYTTWLAGRTPDKTNLWTYLESVFNTANTTSLNQQLKLKAIETLEIGDVFVTGPPPGYSYGHAIIVVDKCINKQGKVKFMLAQSYMPAQEIQILDNPANPGCPWYDLDFGQTLDTPEWDFKSSQLKTFE
ncbi:MAG: hypothetical protein RL365_1256 [Bacteroidota bacterium]|jgi:hypothetical protein